ncbi:MAG: nucleotidyltransferase family protein [Candidatus Thermoplasmatota archaeon]|nr:nucleotidyltransferase family protein [Candidatus Thermoplasmatota archaeon]
MYTALILAGGFSSRMGQDKAFMHGGIPRLTKELRQSGCTKIVVLCGSEERAELFDEECWPDPEDADCLAEVIRWAINKLEGVIQFVPCDAFLVSSKFFTEMSIGVPLDSEGRRQPLLARIEKKSDLIHSNRIETMFQNIPSVELPQTLHEIKNFNDLNDFNQL